MRCEKTEGALQSTESSICLTTLGGYTDVLQCFELFFSNWTLCHYKENQVIELSLLTYIEKGLEDMDQKRLTCKAH